MSKVKTITMSIEQIVPHPSRFEQPDLKFVNMKPEVSMTLEIEPEDELSEVKTWLRSTLKSALAEMETDCIRTMMNLTKNELSSNSLQPPPTPPAPPVNPVDYIGQPVQSQTADPNGSPPQYDQSSVFEQESFAHMTEQPSQQPSTIDPANPQQIVTGKPFGSAVCD